jgi:Reverse transcriptase (RNA-dependent DNA polymerase)
VNDILLIGNDIFTLDKIKSSLNKVLSMKDLGETTHILGIKIYKDRSRKLIELSQGIYIDKVCEEIQHARFQERKLAHVTWH